MVRCYDCYSLATHEMSIKGAWIPICRNHSIIYSGPFYKNKVFKIRQRMVAA